MRGQTLGHLRSQAPFQQNISSIGCISGKNRYVDTVFYHFITGHIAIWKDVINVLSVPSFAQESLMILTKTRNCKTTKTY